MICLILGQARMLCAKKESGKPSKEYQIKAAYLYNFLKTIEWPEPEENIPKSEKIILGIIGPHQFGNALNKLGAKTVKNKKLLVRHFPKLPKNESIRKKWLQELHNCQLVYVCRSVQDQTDEILETILDQPILTVGESPRFLEAGGIINFVADSKRGGFQIDLAHAKRIGLAFSSKLLRLAERVYQEEQVAKAEK